MADDPKPLTKRQMNAAMEQFMRRREPNKPKAEPLGAHLLRQWPPEYIDAILAGVHRGDSKVWEALVNRDRAHARTRGTAVGSFGESKPAPKTGKAKHEGA